MSVEKAWQPSEADLLVEQMAMIGKPLEGFDLGKRDKKQKINSPIGQLSYNPDKQFRDGTIRLLTKEVKDEYIEVTIHYLT